MAYSTQLIADYFLTHTTNPLTAMQMIKMTYIAHGYTLAITKEPLIRARIEAWKYGPVIPVLYQTYKGYGERSIDSLNYCGTMLTSTEFSKRKEFIASLITSQTKNILDQIIDIYSPLSALELSALTHQKGTPWHQCYVPGEFFTLIPNDIIQEFYERKMNYGESGH